MSFSADWLSLRQQADRAARSADLAAELAELVEERVPLRVLDLGAGTGANMQATAPFLSTEQHWLLVDADKALLSLAEAPFGVTMETRVADLSGDLAALFDPAPDLVTASAFFDLAGRDWLARLVEVVSAKKALFYTVLTYDGREEWHPPHALDTEVLPAFHADQRSDKGLGPALGPDAAAVMTELFEAAGYDVMTKASDWQLTSDENSELIAELARGSARAVRGKLGDTADRWLEARETAATVMIGHVDMLAIPPDWS